MRARSGRAYRFTLLSLLVAALILPSCASEEQRFAEHLEEAARYREDGRFREATLELRGALQLRPKSAEVNLRLGDLMREQESYEEAFYFYREAHRLDPSLEEAALAQARLTLGGDAAAAHELVDDVLERSPDNVEAHVVRSEIHLAEVELDRALTAALTAVELAPEDPRAHLAVGMAHQARTRQGQVDRRTGKEDEVDEEPLRSGVAAFDRALELARAQDSPVVTQALLQRAKLLAAWPGRGDATRAAYLELLEHVGKGSEDPKMVRSASQLARRYARRTDDVDYLAEVLRRSVELEPSDVQGWVQLAYVEHRLHERGEEVFRKLLAANGEDPEAHVAYATFLVREGRVDEGIEHLREAAARLSEVPPLRLAQARLLYGARRPEEAGAVVERMAEAHPDHPLTRVALGLKAMAEQRWGDAIARLQGSAAAQREDAQEILATAYRMRGQLPEAREAAERAIELSDGFDAGQQRMLLRIQRAQQDWRAVLRTLRRLARGQRGLTAWDESVRAAAYRATGREQAARTIVSELVDRPEPVVPAVLLFADLEGAAQPERARALLEEAFGRHPQHLGLMRSLVELDLQQGRTAEAVARLAAVSAERPEDAALRVLHARVLLATGGEAQEDRALELGRSAFELDAHSQDALDFLYRFYVERGRLDEAVEVFASAEAEGELGPSGRVLLARLYTELERDEEAITILEKALASDVPAGPMARNDLAFLLARQERDLDRALDLAREARRDLPGAAHVADTLGFVLHRKGLHDAAIEQFRLALELADEDDALRPDYQLRLGRALHESGRHEEAAEAFEAALDLDEDFAGAAAARDGLQAARAAAASEAETRAP